MTSFQIVALYTALALLLNVPLMLRVGRGRLAKKINLGDGGDADMIARVRAHGNFIENAALSLIALFALAMLNGSQVMMHILGSAFIIGRVLHALGMAGKFGQGRLIGTLLTLLFYIVSGLYILYLAFFAFGPV